MQKKASFPLAQSRLTVLEFKGTLTANDLSRQVSFPSPVCSGEFFFHMLHGFEKREKNTTKVLHQISKTEDKPENK